jgi:hypothetical protein
LAGASAGCGGHPSCVRPRGEADVEAQRAQGELEHRQDLILFRAVQVVVGAVAAVEAEREAGVITGSLALIVLNSPAIRPPLGRREVAAGGHSHLAGTGHSNLGATLEGLII